MGEVRQILERYNFEVYDAERLSLAEQMQLFSESRYIVGLHGAGLTNIIFRRDEELSLLEIFPPNNIPPHYYWLASIYGHKYDAIAGFLDQDNQRSIPFTSKVFFFYRSTYFRAAN
jgi:capsular polysaccharide biosynthesis protein